MSARPAQRVVVVGGGKLGREVGLFFLRRGLSVAFRSRDPGRLAQLERAVGRGLRHQPGASALAGASATFLQPGAALPEARLALETVEEALEPKREVFAALAAAYPPEVPLASNSSSFLPSQLHPRAHGLHFFRPVDTSGFVEWVQPGDAGAPAADALGALLREVGLVPIVQREARAFAVNRVLLPAQAVCLRALLLGAPPEAVDAATVSALFPLGHLALLDAVGLDVVAAAVQQYRGRLAPERAAPLAPLAEGLAALLAQGKRGQKNGDGLLLGQPLPFARRDGFDPAAFGRDAEAELLATARGFAACGELTREELALAWGGLFGAPAAQALDAAAFGGARG